jgi:hypothetical protein
LLTQVFIGPIIINTLSPLKSCAETHLGWSISWE